MGIAKAIGLVLLFCAVVLGVIYAIRRGNQLASTTPGRRTVARVESDYRKAGITLEEGLATQVAKGNLQSVPFTLTLFATGKPPRGVFEVPDARGGDFSLAREWNDMRAFIRLGAGHALQTGDEGMDPRMDALLADAEREAARALFHLGIDEIERKDGKLRAVKHFCPSLPELDALRRALDQFRVLRSGAGT